MTAPANVRGYVLAGGGSRRFGRDKALVEFDGEPLIARLIRILQTATTAPVQIVGDAAKYSQIGVECVADRWPGEGPLGGIITALEATNASLAEDSWNLIIGCDMPFLTSEWLRHMAERAAASQVEVVVPESTYGLEPLCACWRASAAPTLTRAFESGVRRVTEAMKQMSMEVLDAADWKRFDNFDRLFWNMNTPADHQEAIRILKAERL
ncbi:MAG TPA: molybdenum cofactor guanylyltransferase [Candidatus Eremiobacteraceae bacterium]|nr:molybdenum cofactor guanylyltransferase [Candidatus Eremiobacteraceae bacterium]